MITIVRTDWIDDDGSGTTGTVLNNAVKTDLYNQIDGALAKAAQLAGGNTFTGAQWLTGSLTVGTAALVVGNISAQFNFGPTGPFVWNDYAAAANNRIWDVVPTTAPLALNFRSVLDGYSTAYNWLTVTRVAGNGAIAAIAFSQPSDFLIGPAPNGYFHIVPGGLITFNTPANVINAQVCIATDGAAHGGVSVQNTGAGNNLQFGLFLNSVGGLAGAIQQTGATAVAFQTTSDARLKDDAGRATDLSALRDVVVHDFTWKADGVRDRGVFAQEAHALYPRAVSQGTDERTDTGDLKSPWMADYSKFVADLIVGWQQHDAELEMLRAELAALKG